jgi:hypothetical protein
MFRFTGHDQPKSRLPAEATMQHCFDLPEVAPDNLVQEYLNLTRKVMPTLARTTNGHWPVRNDHCFQRIVLDTICGGVWYDHIARPAYKRLSHAQTALAIRLCEQIIAGEVDLAVLNQQSLAWRGKLQRG